jgi:hypothetical protein
MAKLIIDVDEHGITRVSVDGIVIGCVQHLDFQVDAQDTHPRMKISLYALGKVGHELIEKLKTIWWVVVEELPCGKDGG